MVVNLSDLANCYMVSIKVAVKQFAHAINCFINTADTKPYITLNHRYSVNNSGSQ